MFAENKNTPKIFSSSRMTNYVYLLSIHDISSISLNIDQEFLPPTLVCTYRVEKAFDCAGLCSHKWLNIVLFITNTKEKKREKNKQTYIH